LDLEVHHPLGTIHLKLSLLKQSWNMHYQNIQVWVEMAIEITVRMDAKGSTFL
jgi:hypothetical protein